MKNLRKLIESTNGRIFSITFKKKNGDERTINGRLDVNKYVTGKGLAFNPNRRGLIVVYDFAKKDYRMVTLKTISRFKCGQLKLVNV